MTTANIDVHTEQPGRVFVEVDRRFDVAIIRTDAGLELRIYPRSDGVLWDDPCTTFEVDEAATRDVRAFQVEFLKRGEVAEVGEPRVAESRPGPDIFLPLDPEMLKIEQTTNVREADVRRLAEQVVSADNKSHKHQKAKVLHVNLLASGRGAAGCEAKALLPDLSRKAPPAGQKLDEMPGRRLSAVRGPR